MAKLIETFEDLNTGENREPVSYLLFVEALWRGENPKEEHIQVLQASGMTMDKIILAGTLLGTPTAALITADGSASLGKHGRLAFAGDSKLVTSFIEKLPNASGKRIVAIE